ncbi:MAG TPA: chemotaxis protein CheX [Clostridiales bacterium]|jgi:chemotaxis protein CheX|nr:chemotaxis protein CheX [Clostridiales bacterium]
MVHKLYRDFVDATQKVFNLMLNISDVSEHPSEDFKCDDEVDIVVGVVGDLQGKIVYRFPVSTSLNMVNIMSGMEFNAVDVFVASAISEIANIISGNVMTTLSDSKIQCDILPPEQYKLDANDNKKYEIATNCCICTIIGKICLEIRLNRAS